MPDKPTCRECYECQVTYEYCQKKRDILDDLDEEHPDCFEPKSPMYKRLTALNPFTKG